MALKSYPELNDRAIGWLRFLWDKATTPDDWSSDGKPHEWWDAYSNYPTLSFPRFDLVNSTYALPAMVDCTPAWREIYARIVDELAQRHTTHWAAIDWLTQFGDDPDRNNYSDFIHEHFVPEHLRGKYDTPGWTANGIEPYGLQPDPIGAEGMLFFRGFFNLVLSTYNYVSDDGKWNDPFPITGYQNQQFQWSHKAIADYTSNQWRERPEGPHCENTKIWPMCLSIAGLGLQLYDHVSDSQTHSVFEEWVEYTKDNYMSLSDKGTLEWFCRYYDPVIEYIHPGAPITTLGTAGWMLPQNPEFATFLYDQAVSDVGWNNPRMPVADSDPRLVSTGLLMAREIGDSLTEDRLRCYAETQFQPQYFGEYGDRFGWWFNLGENYPRGQWSGLMMIGEVGKPGDWVKSYSRHMKDKFVEPTLEGVDFPFLGISQAWNDKEKGVLIVSTEGGGAKNGQETTFRISQLPDTDVIVINRDGKRFGDWEVLGEGEILIRTMVASHSFHIYTGYHDVADAVKRRRQNTDQTNKVLTNPGALITTPSSLSVDTNSNRLIAAKSRSCPCCTVG
jgi:hypothetical protein